MQIVKNTKYIPNLSLALGFFDGVHDAHRKLIEKAIVFAKKNNSKSAVVTFAQQPYCFLNNIEPKYIAARKESYDLIRNLGVDYLIELDFEKIAKMTSLEYLRDILVKHFSPIGIFTGFNHHFGLNREGNCDFLTKYSKIFGYKYESLNSQKLNGELISSSAIRKFLEKGKIEKANIMLGREFSVSGIVVEGNKIGRTINFPTANIFYPKNIIEIPNGVYSVYAELCNGNSLKGIANFGVKPTVNKSDVKILETHILNGFDEYIYGQNIKIRFKKFIRPEQKFDSLKFLKTQIIRDIQSV